jgi:hypothetical protein
VTLQLGIPQSEDRRLVLPMTWRASGREELLPTFDGELETSDTPAGTHIQLTGTYTVPLGVLGTFGDCVLGRRLARLSLETLVQRLATRLEFEVRARLHAVSWHPAPHPVDLREKEHPEIYVG